MVESRLESVVALGPNSLNIGRTTLRKFRVVSIFPTAFGFIERPELLSTFQFEPQHLRKEGTALLDAHEGVDLGNDLGWKRHKLAWPCHTSIEPLLEILRPDGNRPPPYCPVSYPRSPCFLIRHSILGNHCPITPGIGRAILGVVLRSVYFYNDPLTDREEEEEVHPLSHQSFA